MVFTYMQHDYAQVVNSNQIAYTNRCTSKRLMHIVISIIDSLCFRDCFIIASVNSATSLVGGLAVFSVLGFMATKQNTTVANVADSGRLTI